MATPVIQQVVVVPAPEDQVMAQLMSVSGADSYAPAAQSHDTITLSRRRIPVWAIVLAIIFFPIGLLFLLVKNTEVVQITLGRVQGGTQVTIAGRASAPLLSALQYALSGYRATAAGLPPPPGPVPAGAGTPATGPPPGAAPSPPPAEEETSTSGPRIPPPYGPPEPPPPPTPPSSPLPGGTPGGPAPPPAFGPPGGQPWEPPAPPGAPPKEDGS